MKHNVLKTLDDPTAVALLSSRHLGRLAFAHENWPVILPVNFAFEDPTIVIRSARGSKLAEAPFTAVAFEVDDAGTDGTWGWSVLIQGPAFDITDADDERSTQLRTMDIPRWAPGERDHWLTVNAVNLTGRAYGDVPALREQAPAERPAERTHQGGRDD